MGGRGKGAGMPEAGREGHGGAWGAHGTAEGNSLSKGVEGLERGGVRGGGHVTERGRNELLSNAAQRRDM